MFQTDAPLLHHLKAEVMKLLKEILSDFIQVEVVRHSDPFEVDIHQPRNRVPIEHVCLGILATTTLTECFNSDPAGVCGSHVFVLWLSL